MTDPFAILAELRDGGWRVLAHHDAAGAAISVFINHTSHRKIEGSGSTDLEALTACAHQANMLNIGIG